MYYYTINQYIIYNALEEVNSIFFNYKLYYGRITMEELNQINDDTYDKKTHKSKRLKFTQLNNLKLKMKVVFKIMFHSH